MAQNDHKEQKMQPSQDTEGQRLVEQELEEERSFIAIINDNISVLVVVLDHEGRIIRYNSACEVITGLSFTEVKHKYYWDIFCLPEEMELYKAFFATLSPQSFPYEVENHQLARDGSMRTILWTSNILLNQDGTIKNYVMTGSDITSRKETEDALRELGEKYRALIHASPLAVISLDNATRIKSWSAAAEQVFGWAEHAVLGEDIIHILDSHNKQVKFHAYAQHVLKKVLKGKSLTNLEMRCYRKDGMPVHINLSMAPLRNHTGEINGIVLLADDISARKLTEKMLEEERNKALQIHTRSLPLDFPVFDNIQLTAYYQPASELRGDFYNAVRKGEQLLIYLIDVAGKGLDGVMLSVFIREAIENYTAASNNGSLLAPAEVLQYLLEQYHRENSFGAGSLCIFLAVLDFRSGELRYTASDFGMAPLFAPFDGPVYELGLRDDVLKSNGMLQERSVKFTPGSTIFFSTDGLLNQSSGDYGLRLKKVLTDYAHLPPELISMAVREDYANYYGSIQGEDDIAFVIAQAVKQEQCMSLEVESDFAVIKDTVDEVLAFINAQVPVDTDLLDFHELLVNAIEHGNKRDGAKKVVVDVIVNMHFYKIVISDQGDGFNWRERLTRELDPDDFFERGRGIIMTKLMSDYLGYNERGNRVTLINRLT